MRRRRGGGRGRSGGLAVAFGPARLGANARVAEASRGHLAVDGVGFVAGAGPVLETGLMGKAPSLEEIAVAQPRIDMTIRGERVGGADAPYEASDKGEGDRTHRCFLIRPAAMVRILLIPTLAETRLKSVNLRSQRHGNGGGTLSTARPSL